MMRCWCCRDLEGDGSDTLYIYVGEVPPVIDDDGEWVEPDHYNGGYFYSEEEFRGELNGLLANVEFPKLDKGERVEMKFSFE